MGVSGVAEAMHHFLEGFVYLGMIGLEIMGALVIVYGAVLIFLRLFKLKYSQPCTDMRIRFARVLSLGLEFFLAAEIFKTVLIKGPADLVSVGMIVVLRTAMAILIHWEMKHDMEALIEEHQVEHLLEAETAAAQKDKSDVRRSTTKTAVEKGFTHAG